MVQDKEGSCLWMCVGSATEKVSISRVKKRSRGVKPQKKVCQSFGCLGHSKVVAARVFLGVVSKINIVRKRTISVHCTARNVGVSFAKVMERLPCCCHSSHLRQPSY